MWVSPGELDLTYCTNIHAGESWAEVLQSLRDYALPLKSRLSPGAPFALGLRLSAVAAEQLLRDDHLASFKGFLDEHGLYIAILNGFPFGSFHGEPVKTGVFAPDWRDPARLRYTLHLAQILEHLLPDGTDGGVSTIPLSYKPWIANPEAAWPTITAHLAELIAELVTIHQRSGKLIHLDIEPEPNGLIESTAEFIAFFRGPLLHLAAPALAERLSIPLDQARTHLHNHVQVCFDVCHLALQYEDLAHSIRSLQENGIRIGRLQISSALRVPFSTATTPEQLGAQLAPFADAIYLHQVVECTQSGELRRYPDLGDALAAEQNTSPREWRIHFHLPLFLDRVGNLLTTQAEIRHVLALAVEQRLTTHLEIETYTWHVLPDALKLDLLPSIERELRWLHDEVASARTLCAKH